MMRLLINFLAASAGGGVTYMLNVLPHLAVRGDVEVTVMLGRGIPEEFRGFNKVAFLELDIPAARRLWYEQGKLPGVIRESGADVLLSAGNFALRNSPVPQILLSRNSLYTSADFYRDLLSRGEYRMWLDTRLKSILAKRSIHWADVTVAPSQAFAADLHRWTGVPVQAIHHGFDRQAFAGDQQPLNPELEEKLRGIESCAKLLFVSHYNYYRNFETLIGALPLLRDGSGRSIKLLLTCELAPGKNPGAYRTGVAAELLKRLGVQDMVVELGAISYRQLHQLYACADLYVTPAYTETFAHPLVEAMASGIPVVASDLAVHREICGDAAEYFPKFSADALAEKVLPVLRSPERAREMSSAGLERSQQFSWKVHVEKIIELCQSLLSPKHSGAGTTVSLPVNRAGADVA